LSFQTFAAPILYFVTFGAVLVLFCSVIAVSILVLMKLRRLLIRLLGGSLKEQPDPAPRSPMPRRGATKHTA
jgi:hypothetical protein